LARKWQREFPSRWWERVVRGYAPSVVTARSAFADAVTGGRPEMALYPLVRGCQIAGALVESWTRAPTVEEAQRMASAPPDAPRIVVDGASLRLAAHARLVFTPDRVRLLCLASRAWSSVDGVGASVLRRLVLGTADLERLAQDLADEYAADAREVYDDVAALLRALVAAGLLVAEERHAL
jgi:hypothetical protein